MVASLPGSLHTMVHILRHPLSLYLNFRWEWKSYELKIPSGPLGLNIGSRAWKLETTCFRLTRPQVKRPLDCSTNNQ